MAIRYKILANILEEMIEKNIRKGIEKLPTELELSASYRVSRQTVRSALALLEDKGLIRRVQGSGSYITGRLPDTNGNTVGILLTSDQEYIYPGVLNDIRNRLASDGFTEAVYPTDNDVSREREILKMLLERPPRGLIVEGCKSALPNPNLDLYYRLRSKNCPLIFLYNYYPAFPDPDYIKDDNYYGSAMLVRHLTGQGHIRIGGIFKYDDMQGRERYQGFVETMRDLGLAVPDRRVGWYGQAELSDLVKNEDAFFLQRLVSEALSDCTAVICYNDVIAYHLIHVLQNAGYRLPADMAITAFDNTYLSNSDILSVTTLSHQPHEMGSRAAEALLTKLKGLPVSSQEVPWKLNRKESTAPEPF